MKRHLPDRPEQVRGHHPTRLWGPGPGRKAGVQHVDVDGDVNQLRPVHRLHHRPAHDLRYAEAPDLIHQVPAQPLFAHPVEDLARRPVAAQPDLHEVAAGHHPRLHQPPHRSAMGEGVAEAGGRGIGVGVKVDDPELAPSDRLRDRRRRRQRDRVVAADHDRDDLAGGDLPHLLVDGLMRCLHLAGQADRITIVDNHQLLQRRHLQVQVPLRQLAVGGPDRPRSEAGPGAVGGGVVERGSHDGDVGLPAVQLGLLADRHRSGEGGRAQVGRPLHLGSQLGCDLGPGHEELLS